MNRLLVDLRKHPADTSADALARHRGQAQADREPLVGRHPPVDRVLNRLSLGGGVAGDHLYSLPSNFPAPVRLSASSTQPFRDLLICLAP